MKESEFIEQNKEKWHDFENNLLKKDVDPSKTSKLFVQITDDLSYARTFYQNRSVKFYLNGIAKLLFNDLNKSNKKETSGFIDFWKKDLPLTVYKSRRAMLISFFVFVACFILGILTSMQDKEFASTILSNDYVNMTNENIAKGDPMAVYKRNGEMETFLPILYNNLKVDFLTFFSGIFMAIGSLVIMVFNGVMVGVFQYFFIERGLFWESFLGIWTHGALEISAIILSGGAGLTLGKGLLFPGTHSRFQAFKLSGMDGLKIILGVAPITLLAAFIEGFLTRHTSIPDALRFTFILMSFAFILAYFFFYPRKVAAQNKSNHEHKEKALIYKAPVKFDPSEIYPGIKIITQSFHTFFEYFSFFSRFIFFIPLACAILIAWNPLDLFHAHDDFEFSVSDLFNYNAYPFLGVLSLFCLSGITLTTLLFLRQKLEGSPGIPLFESSPAFKTGLTAFLSATLFSFIIFTGIEFTFTTAQVLFPLLIFICCVSNYQDKPVYEAISYSGNLLSQSWAKFISSAFIFALLNFVIYLTATYGLKLLFIKDALLWILTDDELVSEKISLGLFVFQSFFSFTLYILLSVISNSLLFYTLKESYTAEHLISKIKAITVNK